MRALAQLSAAAAGVLSVMHTSFIVATQHEKEVLTCLLLPVLVLAPGQLTAAAAVVLAAAEPPQHVEMHSPMLCFVAPVPSFCAAYTESTVCLSPCFCV